MQLALCDRIRSTLSVHLFIPFWGFFPFSKWMSNSKRPYLREAHSLNNTSRVGVDFSITLTMTCFVCVPDLQVIAWPALTRSLERWIKISYLHPMASKTDFHLFSPFYESFAASSTTHSAFFCYHSLDQTLKHLHLYSFVPALKTH